MAKYHRVPVFKLKLSYDSTYLYHLNERRIVR